MPNSNRRLNDWRPRSPLNALIERVLKKLRMRTDPKWMLFAVVLFLVLLSGCASKSALMCPPSSLPPTVLLEPPPPPGAMTKRLDQILKQGQTSAPTSTTSPDAVTPK